MAESDIISDFSSKIKKVCIPLYGYKFFHGPSDIDNIDSRFIGRIRIIERLKLLLTNSSTKSGAYLVTGYRGIGKSSFVSKAISEINEKKKVEKKKEEGKKKEKKLIENIYIKINLIDEELNELFIFRNIAKSMQIEYLDFSKDCKKHLGYFVIYFGILLILSYSFYHSIKDAELINHLTNPLNNCFIYYSILFLIIFLMTWGIIKFISRFRIFGNITKTYIKRRLYRINELIETQLTIEKGIKLDGRYNPFINIFSRTKKNYPIADKRSIEKELIEILENISKIPKFNLRVEFVFIFDELDKIEPITDDSFDTKTQTTSKHDVHFHIPVNIRKRQMVILKLLANLKYFLTTAKAKFIFIAGREIYDAYLADMSDKNSYIGSIFNDVIYVESFFADSTTEDYTRYPDITGLTEKYVCQFLFPKEEKGNYNNLNLKDYFDFLMSEKDNKPIFENLNYREENISQTEKNLRLQKIEKIIFTLHQFIIYLTHISNGSPKKITAFFEKFIETNQENQILYESNKLLLAANDMKHAEIYLCFPYYKQYTIGMFTHLVYPIILSLSNMIRVYGDKLLVSASFLIDELFKFHRQPFSWRNIESTPEMIDIHKNPELRNFIKIVIEYLSKTHLEKISSGIYFYKFPKKISQEIIFLSKINEEASAIFNFTLDESLKVKKHFEDIMMSYEHYHSEDKGDNKSRTEYTHSISAMKMLIGDIYFYDEEYGEAIRYYNDSIHKIRYKDVKTLTVPQMILLSRGLLKIGLANEKRNSPMAAFGNYGEISSKIMEFRDVEPQDLGLDLVRDDKEEYLIQRCYTQINNYYNYFRPRNINKNNYKNIIDIKNFNEEISKRANPVIENILFKLTTFEGIRLVYQSFLAKFQIIEKYNIGGITNIDLIRLESEFNFLTKSIQIKEKYLIEAEFWNKVGEILYYKNCYFDNNCTGKTTSVKCDNKIKLLKKYNYKLPCLSCKYYKRSLNVLLNNLLSNNNNQNNHIKIFNALKNRKLNNMRLSTLKSMAYILSNIGDVYFACSIKNVNDKPIPEEISEQFLGKLINFIYYEKHDEKYNMNFNDNYNQLELSLLYYYYSAIFYNKSSMYKEYSFQLTKILFSLNQYIYLTLKIKNKDYYNQSIHIIKYFMNENKDDNISIKNSIVKKALTGYYKAYEHIHRYEIEKFRKLFTQYNKKAEIKFYNLSVSEIKELMYTYNELNIICKKYDYISTWNKCISSSNKKSICNKCENHINNKCYINLIDNYFTNHITPYFLNDNMYNRIIQLKYKTILNYEIINGFYEFNSNMKTIDGHINNNGYINIIYYFLLLFIIGLERIERGIILVKLSCIISDNYYNQKTKIEIINEHIEQLFKNNEDKRRNDINHFMQLLIVDSIFCFSEIIRLCNIYGKSFLVNHSYLASMHEKLSDWIKLKDLYSIAYNLFQIFVLYFRDDTFRNSCNKIRFDLIRKLKINKFSDLLELYIKSIYFNLSAKDERDIENSYQSTDYKKIVNIKELFKNNMKRINEKKQMILNQNQSNIDSTYYVIEPIENLLNKTIENETLNYLTEKYYKEKAIQSYHSAIETHTEGDAYINFIENMYFLNDDYNDRLFHYCIANERFRMNNNIFKEKIDNLNIIMKPSKLYDIDAYNKSSVY